MCNFQQGSQTAWLKKWKREENQVDNGDNSGTWKGPQAGILES